MKSRWDPGIGVRLRQGVSDEERNPRWDYGGSIKSCNGIVENRGKEISGNLADRFLSLIIFMRRSMRYQGNNDVISYYTEIGIFQIWKIWDDCVDSVRGYGDLWQRKEEGYWFLYKGATQIVFFFIGLDFLFFTIQYSKGLIVIWFSMAQGQLVGSMGETRNGEGTRKRLKITVAHFDNSDLIKSCAKILVGRCMNPPAQEMKALLTNLLKIWKLEDRVIGKDLGLGKFQFEFEKEEDIEGVLQLQPYHFDFWMVAVAKWQPKRSPQFPSEIPFWVRVLGVSKEFRTVQAFESIGDAIGRVIEVDLDHMRVLVVVDAFKELCFETSVDFKGGEFYDGEEVPILLRYEKLIGYCEECGSLCHHEAKCPTMKGFKQNNERKMVAGEGNGGWHEGNKYDDRARSYKGVVLHGNGPQQSRERETREYYGKGKGKMVEDNSKWVKMGDRSNRRPSGNKGSNRGDAEASKQQPLRQGETRTSEQVAKKNGDPGRSTPQQTQFWSQEEAQEEGEIEEERTGNLLLPSQEFQAQLAKTQAVGNEVVSDPIEMESGLKQLQGLVEGNLKRGEDEIMEWEDLEVVGDLPEPTEEELAALNLEMEEYAAQDDTEIPPVKDKEEEQQVGDEALKQSTKKRLFKSTSSTVASSKMRSAKALASPRKRAPARTGTRMGETRGQQESKAANLLAVHQKP
ncbi:hypothetical protein Rs2_15660 [Raphanus sativus]|nr:hypothetical protein Rs2_15660 [Raphanus sativus]